MGDKKKFFRILLYAALLFTVYVFQEMIFSRVKICGVSPLLLPIICVGNGIFTDKRCGCIVGFFCGVLCDFSYPENIVTFTLTLCFLGLLFGYLGETVLARGFPSFFFSSLISLLFCGCVSAFPFAVFEKTPLLQLWKVVLGQTVYSALFILPLYYPIRNVCRY